jgi:peptide/nickel transport system substrate-binding protein
MKRLASLLLASALALTAAGCAGQNPAASTQSGPPEAVESGKSSVAYVEELRIRRH